jgi:hypothetical protein
MPVILPDAGVPLMLGDRMHPDWYRLFQLFAKSFNETSAETSSDIDDVEADVTTLATVGASFVFKAPEDETVRLIIKCPFAWSITEATTRTEAGTATCTFAIDGVSLGGSANSASTSEQTQEHSTANSMAAGTDLTVVFSSTSGDCENLTITLKGTRTL